MDFLYCMPAVCVIGAEYEILICTRETGIISVEVGGARYFEENSGVLSSEKSHAKIRVPQSVLNGAGRYAVVFQKVYRKAYFSVLEEPERAAFSFSPPGENFNIYHVSDVHGRFDLAKKCCSYFGGKTDLFVVNGDIGEVERTEDYLLSCRFLGEIAQGKVPVVFTRGNHDARGKLAELFTDYFPANGKDTYYDFTFGRLRGIVFDCGEDKPDNHKEYGGDGAGVPGVNRFEAFRRRETAFLEELAVDNGRFTLAIGHISPVFTTLREEDCFDIERDLYRRWNEQFERLGVRLMLCGHLHKAFLLQPNDERSTLEHNYPVAVGSACAFGSKYGHETLTGAAITIDGDTVTVCFNDSDGNIQKVY